MLSVNPSSNINKILMITPFLRSQRGNSQTAARLKFSLSSRGFNIDVLSLEDHNWQEQLQINLDKSQYSLVHGFHTRYFSQVMQTAPQIRRLPMLLTTTGTDINCDLLGENQHIILETMQAVQKIVVFNENARQNLNTKHPELSDKLVTIPQGVFLETGPARTRKELGLSKDDAVFLLPSGLREVKNIELAIHGLSRVHQDYPELRLLIMGAAIEENYSRRIINLIESQDWIIYLGEVPHAEMRSILALGDVVINTSKSEGQPQGALEAMSLAKPCILTAVPGNLNIINQGIEGYYINNEADLMTAARSLIIDPVQRIKLGQNARQLVESRFSLEQEIQAYSRIYNDYLIKE